MVARVGGLDGGGGARRESHARRVPRPRQPARDGMLRRAHRAPPDGARERRRPRPRFRRASRASKHRRPRRARARVAGDDATRVQREGFVRGCVFRAARRSRDVHADTLRGARRRRAGGRDDAMGRDETEDENEHVEVEDVGANIWRDPVGPEARVSVEPPRERRGRGDEFETATRRKSDDAKGTRRRERTGTRGERDGDGAEAGRRYTARRRC